MSLISRVRLRRLAVETVLLGVLGAGIITVANAHGGDPAKVHSCYVTTPSPGNNPPLGSVRIVKATETCKPNETALDWNAQGLAGPPGPPGSGGTTTVRTATFTAAPNTTSTGTALCNSGEQATGGGFRNVQNLVLTSSRPNVDADTPTGWVLVVFSEIPVEQMPTVFVICSAA
jgi:hypothetical protein